jgi:hypothetical protein
MVYWVVSSISEFRPSESEGAFCMFKINLHPCEKLDQSSAPLERDMAHHYRKQCYEVSGQLGYRANFNDNGFQKNARKSAVS